MSYQKDMDPQFQELLSAFLDDQLTTEQRQQLAEWIQKDTQARALYLEHCRMHAALAWEHGVVGGMEIPTLPEEQAASIFNRRKITQALALAAGIALLIGLAWEAVLPAMRHREWMTRPALGEMKRSSGGELVVREVDSTIAVGDALRRGNYELRSGLINLQLDNGVELVVEAPAQFQLDSALLLVLQDGRLSATVPPSGEGFTVQTPEADVIDLGTEFGVDVTAGLGSEVHVFSGEVEVKSRSDINETLRLFTDQAMRIDESVGQPAGISVEKDEFPGSFDEPPTSYAELVQSLKPLIYYRMPPSDDGLTLIDQSGHGLDARIEPGETHRSVFGRGKVGSAFRTRGPKARTYAILPDYPKTTNNQLSLVAWVRADSRPRWASIAKNWGEGKIGQFHFGLVDFSGELEIVLRGPKRGGKRVRDTVPFPLDSWQHVAFVADGETLRLYRNGVEVSSAPHKPIGQPNIQGLGIGAKLIGNNPKWPGQPSDFWHGRIDELALFNHAITSEDIRRLYEAGQGNEGLMAKGSD